MFSFFLCFFPFFLGGWARSNSVSSESVSLAVDIDSLDSEASPSSESAREAYEICKVKHDQRALYREVIQNTFS